MLVLLFAFSAQAQAVNCNEQEAQQGKVTWSVLYNTCFSRLSELRQYDSRTLLELEKFSTLTDLSLEYEKGQLNKTEFDNKCQRLKLIHELKLSEVLRNESEKPKPFHSSEVGDIFPH